MSTNLLILDDEIKMGKALSHLLTKEGYQVEVMDQPQKALERIKEKNFHLLLCDLKMPKMNGLQVLEQVKEIQPSLQVIMMTAFASTETAIEAMKKGAYDYLIKPFSTDELKILIKRCLDIKELKQENVRLREQLRERFQPTNFVTQSKSIYALLERTRKVAESNATVLITGNSGTGKEVLARIIHQASPRVDKSFVAINCGALTETLLEGELFGHRKGAFTGADEDRKGLFETADQGTLFLDEIGEVSQTMQVKLLRALQLGEIQRVGDSEVIHVDVRVLAATNRDLDKMVEEGQFREDLYYRLNVIPLFIPALVDRPDDIVPLAEHFLEKYGGSKKLSFSPQALDCLENYDWPGNVRELENAVEHASVMAESERLEIDDLPLRLRNFSGATTLPVQTDVLDNCTLEEIERKMIQAAMERAGNNMTHAARQLGVTRRTLGYRLRKYGLYENLETNDGESTD